MAPAHVPPPHPPGKGGGWHRERAFDRSQVSTTGNVITNGCLRFLGIYQFSQTQRIGCVLFSFFQEMKQTKTRKNSNPT